MIKPSIAINHSLRKGANRLYHLIREEHGEKEWIGRSSRGNDAQHDALRMF